MGLGTLDPRLAILQLRQPAPAACLVALVIGSTAWGMVPSITGYDQEPDTYHFMMPYLYSCDMWNVPERDGEPTRNPLKWWVNCASHTLTGNYRVIPAAFGIMIMPLVYLMAVSLTNDRMIGIISITAFVNNPLYSDWAVHGTYDQVWAFFLLLGALFAVRNVPYGAVGSYIASLFAKSMAILYLPMLLYTMAMQDRKNAAIIIIPVILVSTAGLMVFGGEALVGNSIGFYPDRWEEAVFRNISLFWQVLPVFLLFVVVNRSFRAGTRPPNQRLVAVWLLGIFLINPLVYLFTLQDTYAYRYVPLAAFMSIFIGQTIVQAGNWFVESRMRATPRL